MHGLPIMGYRCLNDRNWTMERLSESCEEITGYKPSDLVRRKSGGVVYLELMHPEDRNRVWKGVQSALQRKAPFGILYRIITAAETEKRVLSLGQGIFNPEGNLYAVEGFIIDVSRIENS
jgi:PAS domain S-box-containing protein